MTLQTFLAIVLTMQMSIGMAASSAIGVASARGSFRIDNASVAGNGTLFDGALVETQRATSQLDLSTGAKVQLDVNSRGRVYRDRLVLEKGAGQTNAGPARLEALGLRVIPADGRSSAKVTMLAKNRVQVAALAGNLRVVSANGITVAALAAGKALEFEPPQSAGATAPTSMTGELVKKDGRYFITDETTNVTVELRGTMLDQNVGKTVQITGAQIPGATPAAPALHNAAQIVQVTDLKVLNKKRRAAAAAGAGGAGGAAAGGAAAGGAAAGAAGAAGAGAAAAGVSTAVVAGVAVAAAGAATAIGITVANDETISGN